ncbi:MAG: phage tail protein [Thermoplasmata archaeon]
MASVTTFNDPLRCFKYIVVFSSVNGNPEIGFSRISGLRATITPEKYVEINELVTHRKLPNIIDYNNVVFERGLFVFERFGGQLYDLFTTGITGIDNRGLGDVRIYINEKGQLFPQSGMGIILYATRPVEFEIADLNAMDSKILLQHLTLAHEGFDVFQIMNRPLSSESVLT